ncbi:MAG: hypothetical protein KBG15_01390 [Kofleriaceae bacterium]|nr:hypothetical protein [Kofleriaceae bacterium]
MDPLLLTKACQHLGDTLRIAMQHNAQRALVVFDQDSAAAQLLVAGYRAALPSAEFLAFGELAAANLIATFATLQAEDLVVLVQTQSFRLEAFRIRVELFKRNIKVLEHSNLARLHSDTELARYIDALAYDTDYYRGTGGALKNAIDSAMHLEIHSGATTSLCVHGGVEPSKINLGDFANLPNTGSLFPIGEIFTEAKDLEKVAGAVQLFGFADLLGNMHFVDQPITLQIEKGRVIDSLNSNAAFAAVLDGIRAAEGEIWVRELGFGMNRALGPTRRVSDVGAFERQCGVHLSLGAKHGVYKKPSLRHKLARYHVDVFPVLERVVLDGTDIFIDGAWQPNVISA